jgi:hypothetical protein
MAPNDTHNVYVDILLSVSTLAFAWFNDIMGFVMDNSEVIKSLDLLIGLLTKLLSFGSFSILVLINYEKIKSSLKNIFSKKPHGRDNQNPDKN